MKKIVTIIFASLLTLSCIKNHSPLKFNSNNMEFGVVDFKDTVYLMFYFENMRNSEIKINKVQTPCDCNSTAVWNGNLLKKGQKDSIIIKYFTAYPTKIRECILVYYNGEASPYKLYVEGSFK